jgi:phage tail protein X
MSQDTPIVTRDGDMLDALCATQYDGDTTMLPHVFAGNPWLSTQPPVLPAGIVIAMPARQRPVIATQRLWD